MIKAIIFDFYGVLNEEMEPNLKLLHWIKHELKPKYKLGLLSNAASEFMYEIVPKKEIKYLFNDIVISYQVSLAKPDPKVYELALSNLSVEPKEAVFVDDIERYCIAARSLGMKAIRYEGFEQIKKELEPLLSSVSDN